MSSWNQLASETSLDKTIAALNNNNITTIVTNTAAEALETALKSIPEGAEVMTMTSQTIETIGLAKVLNESGKYNSVRKTLVSLPKDTDPVAKLKLGAAPAWVVGSVHAVTEDGKVMVASQSGSQLPAYTSGSAHVVWIVGTQKIVPNLDAAWTRVSEYVLPLEAVRARKAYNIPENIPASSINKLYILNKEGKPGRTTIIFVKELLGF